MEGEEADMMYEHPFLILLPVTIILVYQAIKLVIQTWRSL